MANALAIWADSRTTPRQLYAQAVNGQGVVQYAANGVQVGAATSGIPTRVMGVATDWEGGYFVAWAENRGAGRKIYGQRFNGSGVAQWGSGVVIASITADPDIGVRVAGDRNGGCYVQWQEATSPRRVYLMHLASNGSDFPGWTAGGKVLSTDSDSAGYHGTPLVPGDGNVYVSWLHPDTGNTTYPQLRVQKFASGSDTPLWTTNGVNLGYYGTFLPQGPSMVYDGSGGVIAFPESSHTSSGRLVGKKVNSAGTVAWTSANLTSTDQGGYQFAVADGSGGAIVAWNDDALEKTIKCARVNSVGTILWSVTLATVGGTDTIDDGTLIGVSDGVGGAIFTWGTETSSFTPRTVFAHRIDGDGLTMWGASPVQVYASPGNLQYEPWVCSDGDNGALIAFTERVTTSSSDNVYLQRISAAGGFPWGTATVLSSAFFQQTYVAVALDNAGFGAAPSIPVPPAASDSRAGLELNIRYLIDDVDKSDYAISSVKMVALMNGAMQMIAGRLLLPHEDVLDVPLVAGQYDYDLSGVVGDIRSISLDVAGRELDRMRFDDIVVEFKQDTSLAYPQGRPAYYSLYETSAQAVKVRIAPTPNTLASFDTMKVRYSLIPSSLTSETSTVPFSDTILRAFERRVAAECVASMTPQQRERRRISMEQVRDWLEMVEMAIREENFRQRVASGSTQNCIMEVTDQWR